MTDFEIRAAEDGDFEAIAPVTNHYIATTTIHFGTEPVTAAALLASARALPRHPVMVATRDGRVVAYAKASVWRGRAAYADTCESGIYVDASAQGVGLGKRLYAALLDAIAAAGFHTVVAGIALPNERSFALHRTLGFTEVGTFREVGRKFDRWHDVSFWQLVLPR